VLIQSGILVFAILLAVFAAKFLVAGAISIAREFDIPQFIIGAFIIGFGTSLPEFAVNLEAALQGNTELAIANILGSNLFNTCIVLGIVGLSGILVVNDDARIKDVPFHMIAALMIAVCGNQFYLDHINYHQLMLSHGIIFLSFFSIYIYYTLLEVKQGATHKKPLHARHDIAINQRTLPNSFSSIAKVVAGLIGLVIGGELIVSSAEHIAITLGLSNRLIGLLIVGPGTSMPELIASLIALKQRNTALVLGNVMGSNLFNIFFTLGITATILPIPFDFSLNQAVLLNFISAVLLAVTFWFVSRKNMSKSTAVLLLMIYGVYIFVSII